MIDKKREEKQIEISQVLVDELSRGRSGRLLLAPRMGKSRIIIEATNIVNPESVLWVTSNVDLVTKDIPEEIQRWKSPGNTTEFTACTYRSVKKYAGQRFQWVLLDEDQKITEAVATELRQVICQCRIGMTGTPTKSTKKLKLYEWLNMNSVFYRITIDQAVNSGFLADYKIKVIHTTMTDEEVQSGTKKKPFKQSEKGHYKWVDRIANTATNPAHKRAFVIKRMHAIYNSPAKFNAAQKLLHHLPGKTLVFGANSKQIDNLLQWTYHSKTEKNAAKNNLQWFHDGIIPKLGLINKGGIGSTFIGLENIIIIQATNDTNGMTTQKLCRSLLKQGAYEARIFFFVLDGTVDNNWVNSAISIFKPENISHATI